MKAILNWRASTDIIRQTAMNGPCAMSSLALVVIFAINVNQSRSEDAKLTSTFDSNILKAVVSIEELESPTNGHAAGTGFLLGTTNRHAVLVTAKHVILNQDGTVKRNLAYRFNQKTNSSELLPDEFFSRIAGNWFISSEVDLACRLLAKPGDSDVMVIPLERLLSQKYLTTAAPVLVLGFPMGLRSEQYARPITRHGIVARSDNGELLLDVFVFPGNSGGPVFYSPVLKTDSSISSPLVNEERLVGLVVDYVPYVDIAVSPQTRRPRVTFEENSGLCHAVPADRILELVSRADFLKFDQQLK